MASAIRQMSLLETKMLISNGVKIFIILLILNVSCHVRSQKAKSVSIVLDAKWKSTSFLLEASEFLSEENSRLFWTFIDEINNYGNLARKSDQEIYDTSIKVIEKLLSPPQVSLLRFYLSLRYYSPMIEMFQQISTDQSLPDCDAVVDINGKFTCNVNEVAAMIAEESDGVKGAFYKVDHRYPSSSSVSKSAAAVLYGELGTKSFADLHLELKKFAEKNLIDYYVRHYVQNPTGKKVRLSGYGVELAIKSTEYKAQDDTKVKTDDKSKDEDADDELPVQGFVFSTLRKNHPELKEDLEKFKNYLMETSSELVPLKQWELQSISLQAAQKILTAPLDEALNIMMDISQNFPTRARSLIKVHVDDNIRNEIVKNQNSFAQNHDLSATDSAIFINGIQYDMESTDIFSLAGVLRSEARSMNALHAFGLEGDVLKNLMKLDLKPKQEWAVDIRDSAVMYVNDIENDSKYRQWPKSLHNLLQMFHLGMLSNIRRNMFHMVIIADPSNPEFKFLYKMAESFYVHNAPVRIGLVFTVNPDMSVDGFHDAGVALLNAFNFISGDKTPYDALSFITDVYLSTSEKTIEADDVIKLFKSKYKDEDFELVFGLDSDYDTGRKLAWGFVNKTGMEDLPKVIINGVPLEQKKVTESDFEETALMEVIQQQQKIAKAVYQGKLTDDDDVLDWLMNKGHVLPRLNKKIITNEGAVFLDFSGQVAEDYSLELFKSLSNVDMTATLINNLKYMVMKDTDVYRPNTMIIVTDLDSDDGLELYKTAVQHMRSTNAVRLGIVHNPRFMENMKVARLLHTALHTLSHQQNKIFTRKLFKGSNLNEYSLGKLSLEDLLGDDVDVEKFKLFHEVLSTEAIDRHVHFSKQVLNLNPGQKMIIADGKAIGPVDSGTDVKYEDFDLFEKYSNQIYTEVIAQHLKDLDMPANEQSNMALKVSSVLLSQPNVQSRTNLKYNSDDYSVLKIPPQDNKRPAMDIHVVVDPVSRGAQKVSALINVLKEVANANIKIFLNSQDKLSDLPLKSFYRYVLEPEPLFTPQDGSILGPGARFTHMPTAPLFTLGMVTPDNWMVEAVKTPYDLDNIRLQDVDSVVYAEFELEHILLEGHCFEQTTGSPPRGLQFTLGNKNNPVMVDTIVMANLGYFQLKASPGAWLLKLRQGPSTEIYDVASHENTDSPQGSDNVLATINSFQSKVIKIRVSKKQGKEHKEILEDEVEEESGIWNSITSSFSSEKRDEDEDGVINIFSLASGHLYERFIRIMMLSVLKNTKSPVKFWFLKNFLSPTIKDFLPHMAKEYGFEYELVQYKWPRWLHQQTEKQRIIWGYKILFLDVLFPLDVKKIIFVDADQVVRTDMKELVELDLEGAPYGYTPFCNSRTDMDGYRFWKSGYWANHLGRRRYHISALYVVDLKKFRQIAAGDRLRGQYHGLSQDPNSLSNLDQDLPNNMIHQVKIKSLPQHWLWCETWCDDASKAEAKTIDLCNNPKTKEPKLVSAMRIIAEWKDYDQEIKDLQDRISDSKTNESDKNIPQKPTKSSHEEL